MIRTSIDTTYAAPTGATTRLKSSDNLQAALDAARPGDVIELEPAATFVGNFLLKPKTGGAPVHIRTANLPPEGKRVGPAIGYGRILTANNDAAVATQGNASNYRFVNVEIGVAKGTALNGGIFRVGNNETALDQLPSNIVIDRCYIHGVPQGDCHRAITLNGKGCAVVDSYISEIHFRGVETQAVAVWNGTLLKVVNNYLEAAGVNFMAGGADPRVSGLVISDVEFRRNHCFKPLSWKVGDPSYAGIHWGVKNLFELKNAQHVWVEDNTLENCWVDGQAGYGIVLTPRNQDGSAPWSAVTDVLLENNRVTNCPIGMQLLGWDYNHPAKQLQRVTARNNLFTRISGAWVVMVDGTDGVTLERNTALQGGNVLSMDGRPHTNFKMTDNIVNHNEYGIMGSGASPGPGSIAQYLPAAAIAGNALVATPDHLKGKYPSGTLYPASIAEIGFSGDFSIAPTSAYAGKGWAPKAAPPPPPPPPPPVNDAKARILAAIDALKKEVEALP